MKWLAVIAALPGLFLGVAVQAAEPASPAFIQQLERCIQSRFEAEQAPQRNQRFNLDEACPALHEQRQQPVLEWLQPPLGNTTTLNQLLDVQRALQSFRLAAPVNQVVRDFDYAGLNALLQGIYTDTETTPPRLSWWQRFVNWLREILLPKDQPPPSWLEDLLNWLTLPDAGTMELILKGALLLLVLLAILTLFNELRAANLLNAWRYVRKRLQTDSLLITAPQQQQAISLHEISQLPDKAFASHLLYLSLIRLMQHKLMPERFSLTNRELMQYAPAPIHGKFQEFINQAEHGIYGDIHYSPEQRERILQLSQHLADYEDKPA